VRGVGPPYEGGGPDATRATLRTSVAGDRSGIGNWTGPAPLLSRDVHTTSPLCHRSAFPGWKRDGAAAGRAEGGEACKNTV